MSNYDDLTYELERGYWHWYCEVCGRNFRDRIPDQAIPAYYHNPDSPSSGICNDCAQAIGIVHFQEVEYERFPE